MTGTITLANRITLARLGTSVLLFALLTALPAVGEAAHGIVAWCAYAVFTVTAASDWLDGHFARKRHEVTVLGRMMDPFVDKVLVCGSLVLLRLGLHAHLRQDAFGRRRSRT